MAKEVKIWYDEEGDHLEVFFERTKGYFKETFNDAVMEKVDEAGNIIGFSITKSKCAAETKASGRYFGWQSCVADWFRLALVCVASARARQGIIPPVHEHTGQRIAADHYRAVARFAFVCCISFLQAPNCESICRLGLFRKCNSDC